MSPGLNFQSLSGLSSRSSSRSLGLVLGDVQEALDHRGAVGDEALLEAVDRGVAARPGAARRRARGPAPRRRPRSASGRRRRASPARAARLLDAPEEVVRELLLGGRLEGRDAHALRVDLADDVADGAALAGGVHALQDEQDAAGARRCGPRRTAAPAGRRAAARAGRAPPCRPACRPSKPGVARVSIAARSTGPVGSRSRSLTRMPDGPRRLAGGLLEVLPCLGMGDDRVRGRPVVPRAAGYGSVAVTPLLGVGAGRAVGVARRAVPRRTPWLATPRGGWWRADVRPSGPGSDYAFLLDDDPTPLPDPRSRWQPAGVHGPSRVYDDAALRLDGRGLARRRLRRVGASTSCTSARSRRRGRWTRRSSGSTTWSSWASTSSS